MNRKVLLFTLAGFLVSSLLGIGLIQVLVGFEVNDQLESRLKREAVAYRSVVHGLSQVAQTLYDETINTAEVTALVKQVIDTRGDQRDIARGLLLRELYPSFQRLQARGIRQLHFHGPDGLSLLRFHSPLKYGDSLFEVRESVRLANTELQPVEGFEAGKLFHGFRFLFPLFYQGQHIGSVETSVSFKTVEANLRELAPNELFEFVLRRDQVFSLLYPSERSIYEPFRLNDEFVIEDVGAKLGSPRQVPALQQVLERALESDRELIHQRMMRGEPFGLTRSLDGKRYAGLFMPVSNVSGDVDAYILTYTQVPVIESLYQNGFWIQLFFVALMASLAVGFYRRQTANLAIAAEREKLQAITERMAEGLFTQDSRGRITFLNEAAERILGISKAEALGEIAHDLFHVHCDALGAPVTLADCPIRSVTARGEIYESEDELFRRVSDGRLIPVQVSSARFNLADDSGGSITIFRDITERKRYEDELERARKEALESTHAKSEFLANMSHEIRTPMNGMLGMIELMLDTPLAREQRDFLKIAQSSGKNLLSLLNSILDLSKYEAGRVELEQIDFPLRSTLEDTVKLFAPQAQGKGLEIAALIAANVPEYVSGDPTRLRQVITNLLGNAIKFTDVGQILLTAELERESDDCLQLHIAIEDTGIGVAPEAQERIFESFSQADGSTTRKYGGTGLGLTLSREIVAGMGGYLWLKSVPGEGSTFHFTVQLQPARDPGSCFVPNHALNGLQALIVDDNATNRLILERYCDSWQIRHRSAASGADALELLNDQLDRGQPFDLVLTDMMMPDMDGVTLAQAIRADRRFDASRLILITSYTGSALSKEAEQAGFDCLLAKPLARDELHDALERTLFGHERADNAPATTAADDARLKGLRVLLAEDNEVNRMVALANLERLGCRVTVAVNGREALEQIERQRFDLVLMDCQMPILDGLSATRNLRELEQQHGWSRLPVIAMTAFVTPAEIQRCLDAGMDAHLGKPFEPDMLRQVLLNHAQFRQMDETPSILVATADVSDTEDLPVLSHEIVSSLQEMLGDELNAVFELFIQQMPELMSDICNAQQANDIDALKAAAHTLKGSASSLGALRLAELCRQLQDQQDMQNLELIALVAEAKKVTESLAERLEKYMLSGLHD